jgi:DNA-binding NarL/FixJ family response regulator
MNRNQPKIRILLVDDHILMRMGFVSATKIEDDMEVVAEVEDGRDAIEAFRTHRPDVVVMDLRLPSMDGVETIAALRAEFGAIRALVLSNYGGGDDIGRAVNAGASGYVMKDQPLEELLEAVRVVHSGRRYFPREVSARLMERRDSQLSERELEVLRLIAKGRSNKEIASGLGVVEGTVKAHVTNIFHKLGAVDRTQAITIAMKRRILQLE